MPETQEEKAAEIAEMFELFDNWEDRYQVLIDLGRKLPPMDPAEKNDQTRVTGCMSNVWMAAHVKDTPGGRVVEFSADSDAAITKGLVSILWYVFSGATGRENPGFRYRRVSRSPGTYLSLEHEPPQRAFQYGSARKSARPFNTGIGF